MSIYKKRNDSKYFSVELPFKYFFTKHICFEKKYWWRPSRVGKHRNQKRVHLGGRKILHHFKSFSSLTSKNFSIKTFFFASVLSTSQDHYHNFCCYVPSNRKQRVFCSGRKAKGINSSFLMKIFARKIFQKNSIYEKKKNRKKFNENNFFGNVLRDKIYFLKDSETL